MAKESGIGFSTASRDNAAGTLIALVNCVTNVDFSITRNSQDVTGMDKSAIERLLLLGDYSSSWTLIYNPSACKSHCVLSTAGLTSVARTETLAVSGQTLTNEVLLLDYQLQRSQDGSVVITAPGALQSGTDPTWS